MALVCVVVNRWVSVGVNVHGQLFTSGMAPNWAIVKGWNSLRVDIRYTFYLGYGQIVNWCGVNNGRGPYLSHGQQVRWCECEQQVWLLSGLSSTGK